MSLKSETRPTQTIACPHCPHLASMTTWRPQAGYDRGIRQYRCPYCGRELYLIFVDLVTLAEVDKVVAAKEAARLAAKKL